jgi:hypothetical protein
MLINAALVSFGAFAVFAGFVAFMRTRRRLKPKSAPPPSEPAFDLPEIRAMLDTGKITQDEHDVLLAAFLKERSRLSPVKSPHQRGFDVIDRNLTESAPRAVGRGGLSSDGLRTAWPEHRRRAREPKRKSNLPPRLD